MHYVIVLFVPGCLHRLHLGVNIDSRAWTVTGATSTTCCSRDRRCSWGVNSVSHSGLNSAWLPPGAPCHWFNEV